MSESIKVDGLDKLVRELRNLNPELADELKQINRDVADMLVPEAVRRTPKRSGRLAASVRATAAAKSGVVRAGGSKVPYANVIHFGWPRHHIHPQAFLYDALDARREEIVTTYVDRVSKIVDEVN